MVIELLWDKPAVVPLQIDFIWSEAALAALIAELNFLAAMTAAPRFWTVGRKTVFNHSSSLTTSVAGLPPMVAFAASGN